MYPLCKDNVRETLFMLLAHVNGVRFERVQVVQELDPRQ